MCPGFSGHNGLWAEGLWVKVPGGATQGNRGLTLNNDEFIPLRLMDLHQVRKVAIAGMYRSVNSLGTV